jgi:hypothetical protein
MLLLTNNYLEYLEYESSVITYLKKKTEFSTQCKNCQLLTTESIFFFMENITNN